MKCSDTIEDLVAQARRNELSVEDERRLRVALESSLEARLLLQAGIEFDAARSVSSGDEMRVERLAQWAVRSSKQHRRRDMKPVALGLRLGAAFLVCCAAATAAWSTVGFVKRSLTSSAAEPRTAVVAAPSKTQMNSAPNATSATSATSATRVAPRVDATIDPPAPAVAMRPPSRSAPALPASPTLTVNTPEPRTAQALFTAANLSRRALEFGRAIELYERLQAWFPESVEAAESRLILGKLQLDRDPRAALRQFHGEASTERNPEALWGEAQALQRLGRFAEERMALERLNQVFPNSAYADAVAKRLVELAR